ncbi:cyclodeaminase/cyclohydrolase family protein [Coprothermobacter platensis]|uniref:cyclodeaminase/cyclohydrolase family protein n=1 Tax=Coprothermobacter platensis TaxID=108819 RepID=UPI0003674249|nr:cyclodeaminase/cyclohydrolase family protein [Coprothermobacter platensis]
MIDKETVGAFLDALSSDAPTPGGGAAAAVVAAMACSLMAMSIRVSQKKVQDSNFEPAAQHLDTLRHQLLILSDEDKRAFDSYMDALHLPKSNEEEKQVRSATIKSALLTATQVPLNTMKVIKESLETIEPVAQEILPAVASDLYSGVKLAQAAMFSAFANVKINSTKKETAPLYEEASSLFEEFNNLSLSVENTAKTLLGI